MVKNIWEDWLNAQVNNKTLPFPKYALDIYASKGINPQERCGSCVHLRTEKEKEGKKVKKLFFCTLSPSGEFSDNWPACGNFLRKTSHK
jgi:hypothetical protein